MGSSLDLKQPLVTVGVPVLNGADLLERALTSITGQTYRNFEIVVSDNASTDRTAEIIRDFASRDARIRCYRQDAHVSAFSNFKFVLDHANGEFFFWAPHDDWWNTQYIETGVAHLTKNPSASAVMGAVRYYNAREEEVLRYDPPYGISDNHVFERIHYYLTHPITDHLFYAMYRTESLRGTIWSRSTSPEKVVIMHMLLQGAVADGWGMEYYNRYIAKSPEEIAATHALPDYGYKYQVRVLADVVREIWRGAPWFDAVRLIPVYFFTQSWHKTLVKWFFSKLIPESSRRGLNGR